MPADWAFWAEWTATSLAVIYVVLAARPSVWAWPFGIASSAVSVALFASTQLYSEAWLNAAYVVLGFVGWFSWNGSADDQPISQGPLRVHAIGAVVCVSGGLGWGLMMDHATDASWPYIDAQTMWFSLFATWLTARKWMENWLYWVVIDLVSCVMYEAKGLHVYALLMAGYTVTAAVAWFRWRRQLKAIEA